MKSRIAVSLMVLALSALLAPLALAELPEGLAYDDGYAYFEVDTKEGTKDGKRFAEGWYLKSSVRIYGRVPARSAFKIVVKKDGQVVSTQQQGGAVYYYNPPAMVEHADCFYHPAMWDGDQLVDGTGVHDVEVYYIDGDDLTEYLARTHKVDVQLVTRSRPNGDPDASEYYVNRHGEAAASFIVQRPRRRHPYIADSRPDYYDTNVVAAYFSVSASPDGRSFENGYLRCTVNGEKLDLTPYGGKDEVRGDAAGGRFYEVVHVGTGNEKEAINFRQYMAILPLTWTSEEYPYPDERYPLMNDHPGDWDVKYIVDGQLIRGWKFTVGEDGMIVAHEEETTYGLSLCDGAHFAEITIPDGGAYIDERLVPDMAKVGGFSGHVWQSEGAKAAGAAVPAKGAPAP